MNWLRHNFVTLALVLAVGAVTALNSYTLEMNGADSSHKLVEVTHSQSTVITQLQWQTFKAQTENVQLRADKAASTKAANEISEQLSNAAHHIRDCHTLLERAGIKPPSNFPLQPCPPDCEKCPLKIEAPKLNGPIQVEPLKLRVD